MAALAHEAVERERVEAIAREHRRAELQAALTAAEVEATSATADLETAHQTERDLHGQLQAAKDHRAAAEARAQAARAVVEELQHQLTSESGHLTPS